MYKLVLYGLFILSGISILFGFMNMLSFRGLDLVYSFLTLTVVCFTANLIFSKIFKVQTNIESSSITALILFLVTFPVESFSNFKLLVLVGVIAMASKYLLAISKKHVFNPAAIALVIMALFGSGIGAWWIGSSVMLIPVAILGFLVLRKLRRFTMFFAFFATAVVSIVIFGVNNGYLLMDILKEIFTSWPIIFFGTIMLTEPLTTPPTKKMQVFYAVLVGALFGSQFHFGNLYATPELALVIGNIFAYIVSPKYRLVLKLVSKDTINKKGDVDEFRFESDKKFNFEPGQYLEWTLGHDKPDSRGNRRFFTISSSPTEKEVMLGIKYYDKPSSFKMKLGQLELGEKIHAGSLSGEFTMPKDTSKKLVFIAGGIGVTPFRSMAKYMSDTNEKRDAVLLYSNKTPGDVAYKNVFDEAEQKTGLKTLYFMNDLEGANLQPNMRLGFITPEVIMKEIPDYKERMFYISGPHGMVTAFQDSLSKLGIPNRNIKTDFFPGFV